MATLDRWRYLLTPQTLSFSHLELTGRDFSPPIVVGAGEVIIKSASDFGFKLVGVPADVAYAAEEIQRQSKHPYDGLARFRLTGVDAAGVEWSLGWTIPRVETGPSSWTFSGELEGLSPEDRSDTVANESSTELILLFPVNHPLARTLERFVQADQSDGGPRHERVLKILESTITFVYESSSGILSITASHSPRLPPTYTENWLGEPLRILFGQLAFPCLVARNLDHGRSIISLRRSPGLFRGAEWAALWTFDPNSADINSFWARYAQLLTFVSQERDRDGRPNFESHKITRLYEEIIQAARGSRWVWALTFASSIEGLVKMLIPTIRKPTQADSDEIAKFAVQIDKLIGPPRLKQIAISTVHRTAEITAIRALRDLKAAGVVSEGELSAWTNIRNAVMHGSLVSPYSSDEDDANLLMLAAMVHGLTREILRLSAPAAVN